KIGIIRNAFPAALQNLLRQLLHHEEYLHDIPIDDPILQTAANYFSDPQAAETILLVLRKFGLTATAIESEACRLVARELEAFDKMQSNAERRRYKGIKFIAQYRKSLSIQTRPVTDSIITEPDALCLKSSTSGS